MLALPGRIELTMKHTSVSFVPLIQENTKKLPTGTQHNDKSERLS